jgi:hypothetical protein
VKKLRAWFGVFLITILLVVISIAPVAKSLFIVNTGKTTVSAGPTINILCDGPNDGGG